MFLVVEADWTNVQSHATMRIEIGGVNRSGNRPTRIAVRVWADDLLVVSTCRSAMDVPLSQAILRECRSLATIPVFDGLAHRPSRNVTLVVHDPTAFWTLTGQAATWKPFHKGWIERFRRNARKCGVPFRVERGDGIVGFHAFTREVHGLHGVPDLPEDTETGFSAWRHKRTSERGW